MSRLSELSRYLVDKFAITQTEADSFVREFFNVIKDNLERDKTVKVKWLGTFKIVETVPRETIDINTRERITIDSRNKLVFVPEAAVKRRVNSPFESFVALELGDDVDFTEIDSRYAADEEEVATSDEPVTTEEKPAEPTAEPELPIAGNEEETPEEEETDNGGNRYWGYVVLTIVAVVLIAAAGWFCYQAGLRQGGTASEATIEENKVADQPTAATDTTLAALAPDTAKPHVSPPDSAALEAEKQALYNRDPRVRLGAYRISGLAAKVKVLPGQTFRGISKAYLGEGMECYVEAYNGGLSTVSPGDTLLIPHLTLKKRIRK